MPRRPREGTPDELRLQLIKLLDNFEIQLKQGNLRQKILALVPAFHKLRDLGSSLIPHNTASSARDRILAYFQQYPSTVIHGDELMVVSGIQDYPRRIRELRCEFGWNIVSGITLIEMNREESQCNETLRSEEYILLDTKQDREAAHRWRMANEIRKKDIGSRAKILEFLLLNIGKPVTGEELRYVTNNRSEWARRVRELRTEEGWLITTHSTGRPDLPVGSYVLESARQSPAHDRKIPDPVRCAVLVRDNYTCVQCGWSQDLWNPADPRHLELHHVKSHVSGGANTTDNLISLCNICHDDRHR
jgi:5-methylcytosine-specific restriction endonuclease McrA